MKVRIDYTIDASDDIRRAINKFYGYPGYASREDVRAWYIRYGSSMDDDLARSLDNEDDAD